MLAINFRRCICQEGEREGEPSIRKAGCLMTFPTPKRVATLLLVVVLCLALASVAGQISRYFLGHGTVLGLVNLFHLDGEHNIPAWFSSSMLFVCGLLLGMVAFTKRVEGARYAAHWSGLSIIFLCMSLDEAIMIHERWEKPLDALLGSGDFFCQGRIIPAVLLIFAFALTYLRFLAHLPTRTRRLFIVAGFVYFAGALGMDIVSGGYMVRHGRENMTYQMLSSVEEILEMLGVVVFVYALLSYLQSELKDLPVRFDG